MSSCGRYVVSCHYRSLVIYEFKINPENVTFPYARHYSTRFIEINSCNHSNNLVYISLFFKWRKRSTERPSKLHKLTQLVNTWVPGFKPMQTDFKFSWRHFVSWSSSTLLVYLPLLLPSLFFFFFNSTYYWPELSWKKTWPHWSFFWKYPHTLHHLSIADKILHYSIHV